MDGRSGEVGAERLMRSASHRKIARRILIGHAWVFLDDAGERIGSRAPIFDSGKASTAGIESISLWNNFGEMAA